MPKTLTLGSLFDGLGGWQIAAVRNGVKPIWSSERLQGLPDGWTYLPGDKSCSDSARYRAVGNGMAQPCADFVIKRIVEEMESD